MHGIRFTVVEDNLKTHHAHNVNQGETFVGAKEMSTILRSCVCVGFYNSQKNIGAISHITGYNKQGGHYADGALIKISTGLRRHGLDIKDCICFVIGGADKANHVYKDAISSLKYRNIKYEVLDSLGSYHRKLLLDPVKGEILLHKKSEKNMQNMQEKTFSSDRNFSVFHDSKKRLCTGASLFFRNPSLLKMLTDTILPDLVPKNKRLHMWCAGCSNGMEVYSMMMVILNNLGTKVNMFDFKILGTDISEEALQAAASGLYNVSEGAIKNNKRLFEKYTERLGAREVQMMPELIKRASFRKRDLRQGSKSHKFEIIVCDHVLQYFDREIQEEMIRPLAKALSPGGFGYAYISSPAQDLVTKILAKYKIVAVDKKLYKST